MYSETQLTTFQVLVETAQHVLIMQAEHIDADSLGSALGLEQLLSDQGKQTTMYAFNEVPDYLKHVSGWDRVVTELPKSFDLTILVDSATATQLERTFSTHRHILAKKPFVAIDHHASETNRIEFTTLELIDPTAGASGQQIVEIANQLKWKLASDSAYALASAIKGDTVNLATSTTTSRTFKAMAQLADLGVDFDRLRLNVEQTQMLPPEQNRLRGQALLRAEFFHHNQIAVTYFTQEEYASVGDDALVIEKAKHDLRFSKGVVLSITITERKGYSNASMRANALSVARRAAELFGGGGHDRAASCRFFNLKHEAVIKKMIPVLSQYIDEEQAANTSV